MRSPGSIPSRRASAAKCQEYTTLRPVAALPRRSRQRGPRLARQCCPQTHPPIFPNRPQRKSVPGLFRLS
ncbi:MAG: hypothetical protein AVDCRST_MAG15-3209 [uncultured Rubellimicrobium sp.]|uniref:Uncharacterized protein n=1 Tax=uncultured Rubellimicrobium sp. TaxID=543078 RepID=A0A6J4QAF7_9RHOB|nr:MAG: hypothetical protein AVDCRST_MAG15-3209 [uncultured Rubellimicrobium sp.]